MLVGFQLLKKSVATGKYIIISLLLFAALGCDKWLDVRPESEVGEADMFSTEQGYMDALYGVYVTMGKDDLYGGVLPLTLDVLGKLFDVQKKSYGILNTRLDFKKSKYSANFVTDFKTNAVLDSLTRTLNKRNKNEN